LFSLELLTGVLSLDLEPETIY